jgi:hypothetical protein
MVKCDHICGFIKCEHYSPHHYGDSCKPSTCQADKNAIECKCIPVVTECSICGCHYEDIEKHMLERHKNNLAMVILQVVKELGG